MLEDAPTGTIDSFSPVLSHLRADLSNDPQTKLSTMWSAILLEQALGDFCACAHHPMLLVAGVSGERAPLLIESRDDWLDDSAVAMMSEPFFHPLNEFSWIVAREIESQVL